MSHMTALGSLNVGSLVQRRQCRDETDRQMTVIIVPVIPNPQRPARVFPQRTTTYRDDLR